MSEFVCLCKQGGRYLAQRVETLDDGIQHHNQVSLAIETLDIPFTAIFTTEIELLTCQAI